MILIGGKVYGPEGEEFAVIRSLGMGGFGQVFLVENIDKSKTWALKTANADGMTDAEYIALQNEGKLASSIQNGNVIKIHYFHDGKEYPSLPPYLLMDYAEGGSLKEFLDRRKASNKVLTIEELKGFIVQICNGMKAVNEKLLHRDLHPGNVLFQNKELKITDFGLSKLVDANTRTLTFKGLQHVLYKAPESWAMQKNTIQMDMYSAGIIFYELAALKYPYAFPGVREHFLEAEDVHQTGSPQPLKPLNPMLRDSLIELIMKLLKKRPGDRFKSWDEILGFLNSEPISAGIDVSSLVAKAQATDQAEEAERIATEKRSRERDEKASRLRYSVRTIADEIEKLASVFNSRTLSGHMSITMDVNGFGFSVHTDKKGKTVLCLCLPSELARQYAPNSQFFGGNREVQVPLKVNNKEVVFWGYLEASGGRGVNLFLTLDNEDDLYGTWKILIHTTNPLAQKVRSVEPFPLKLWSEFSKRVLNMNAMDVIDTEQKPFSIEAVKFLFEEIL